MPDVSGIDKFVMWCTIVRTEKNILFEIQKQNIILKFRTEQNIILKFRTEQYILFEINNNELLIVDIFESDIHSVTKVGWNKV